MAHLIPTWALDKRGAPHSDLGFGDAGENQQNLTTTLRVTEPSIALHCCTFLVSHSFTLVLHIPSYYLRFQEPKNDRPLTAITYIFPERLTSITTSGTWPQLSKTQQHLTVQTVFICSP